LAAAAQAAPEADPQVLLTQPLVAGVYGDAHTQVHSEVKHANGAVVPDDTLSVKAAKAQHLTAKANAYLNKPLVYTAPVVNTVATAPVVQHALRLVHQTVASPVVSYTGAYPHVYGTHYIKREAQPPAETYEEDRYDKREADSEAKPEADPALLMNRAYPGVYGAGLYSHQLVNSAVTYNAPVVSNMATIAAKPIVPTVLKTPVVSYNYGVHTPLTTGYTGYTHLIKREAEADPLTIVNPYTTGLYGNVHGAGVLNTHHMVNPVTYTTPVVSTVNAALPTVVKNPVVSHNYGIHTPLTTGYTGYAHLIKREAYDYEAYLESEADPRLIKREAEADPAVLINGAYPSVYGAGLYGHQLVNPAVTYTTPLVSNVATVAAKPIVPTVVKTPVVSYNYGLHTPLTTGYTGYTHLIKREADSEAQPEAHHGGPHIFTTSYNGVYGAGLYGHRWSTPL